MGSYGSNFSFFDAVDPKELVPSTLDALADKHRPFIGMSSGQFGCSLSHYFAVENWFKNGLGDFLLILEDDVWVTEQIQSLDGLLSACDALPYDVLKIGGHISKRGRLAFKLAQFNETAIVYPIDPTLCTVAYVLRRESAEKFLGHIELFSECIDVQLYRVPKDDFVVLEASPYLFIETGVASTIAPTITAAKPRKKSVGRRISNDLHHAARTGRTLLHYWRSVGRFAELMRIR